MCGISDKYHKSHETECDDCEMCESHDTFVGIDLHFFTKVDLRFLLIVDGYCVKTGVRSLSSNSVTVL